MAKTGGFLLGAVVGGMVGAVAALLMTPASGTRMREQLREYVDRVKLEVNTAIQNKRSELKEELTELRTPLPPEE